MRETRAKSWTNTALAGLAVALVGLASEPASAQWYVSAYGGGNILEDADNAGSAISASSSFDTGYVVGGAIGRGFGPWRFEGEVAYRQNDLSELTFISDGGLGVALGIGSLDGLSVNANGDVSALSFMANVFYDFKLASGFNPYIGGGVGVAQVSANNVRVAGFQVVDDSDTVLAFQAGAGVSYDVQPHAALFLEYRFFRTLDPSLADVIGNQFDAEYQSHSVNAGIRFIF